MPTGKMVYTNDHACYRYMFFVYYPHTLPLKLEQVYPTVAKSTKRNEEGPQGQLLTRVTYS